MKILVTILTTVLLLITIGFGYLLSTVDAKDGEKISASLEELKQSLPEGTDAATMDAFIGDQLKELNVPSPSQFQNARIAALLLSLLGLIVLVLYFMNIKQLKIAIGVLVVLALISMFIHPAFDKGEYGGASNDKLAMAHSAIAIIGGILALYGQNLKNKVLAKA